MIRPRHRYVKCSADARGTLPRLTERVRRTIMRKTILTILGTALIAGATVQFAAAAERHHTKKAARVPAPASDQFRNSNASWPARPAQLYCFVSSGGYSARAALATLMTISQTSA